MKERTPEGADHPDQSAAEIRRLARLALIVVAVVFGGVGLWAVAAVLSGAVIAQGVLKVEVNPQVVQHHEGGIVSRIHIRDGDRVSAGQPVVDLEATEAGAMLGMVTEQLAAEYVRLARLRAENEGAARLVPPDTLRRFAGSVNVADAIAKEAQLFNARQQLLKDQIAKLGQQRRELLLEIESLERQTQAAEQSLAYLKQQDVFAKSLHTQGYVSEARLLDSKRSVSEKEEKKYEFQSLHAQARQKLADVELRIASASQTRFAENSRDIVEAQARILQLEERRRPMLESYEKRVIRAPVAGVVNNLKVHTVGGVIAPREPLMEVTPSETRLVVEAHVSPADVDELSIGQSVELEFVGLPRRSTPLVPGTLTYVSADLITDATNPSLRYYVVRARMDESRVRGFTPKPGMPVSAYIRTRERTPLEYWLDPIIGMLRKSMRET